MSIEFDSQVQSATFYSPLADFDEVTVEVEVREDPLTGRQARIVPESFLMPDEEPDIAPVVEDDEGCFFCPEMVTDATPEYPDWVGFDRGRVGEATSFPNLNPYGAHSNVVALTEDHYRPVDEFTPAIFADGLTAALEYVARVFEYDADAEHAAVNMNFLRPAGSSIIHPHLQTLIDDRGTNAQRELVEAVRAYRAEHGRDYWAALREAERDGERHVGTTGDVAWLAPFAPKHHRHLLGLPDDAGVPDPEGDTVTDLAAGIANVLAYYGDVGLNSFNFALYLTPGERPVIELVSRSVFDQYYWSDSPFFASLHREGVVDVAPEEYAAAAREHF